MDIKTIFGDNISEYSDYVDKDVAENMSRLYYRGIAGFDPDDDNLLSLLIWELKSVENDNDTESELKWIYAIDPSYIAPLLDGYKAEAQSEDVKKTFFESVNLEQEKSDALGECGFSLKSVEGMDIAVTINDCKALAIAKKDAPAYVQSIDPLDDQEFYQGIMNILFRYENPALEDLSYLPKAWYEQSVSCYIKTDGKITGLLLVHACASGILMPVLFFAVGADSKINLIEMMRFSIGQAAQRYPGDTIIRIHRRNPEVKALSQKLFPTKQGEPAIAGERLEKG
jgi:hypothetical protein